MLEMLEMLAYLAVYTLRMPVYRLEIAVYTLGITVFTLEMQEYTLGMRMELKRHTSVYP